MNSPRDLVLFFRHQRFRTASEADLQSSIEEALASEPIFSGFDREVRLDPHNRIDFMVGSIGVEAKLKYPKRGIYRQLVRYAGFERVTSLILISATAIGLPDSIEGKPVYLVSVGRGLL